MAITGTIFVRVAVALLVLGILFNVLMGLALLRPIGRERAELALLPVPAQAAAIVEVLDRTAPAARPRLLDALNSRALSVTLTAALPEPVRQGGAVTRPMERLLTAYDDVFADHAFHIEMRRLGVIESIFGGSERREWEPSRLYVRLHDGSWVLIAPARGAVFDTFLARGLALAGLIGLVILAGLWFAVRQTTRPIVSLAANANAFADTLDAPALKETGPREVRDLARAFNQMKARIRGLVSERTRMLAAIAHDLRTYLTRLRLRAEYIADADQRARAERDIAEMSALIDDTLLFASESEGAARAQPRVADLASEIAAFAHERTEAGEAVTLAPLEPGDWSVRADPLAVRRILANLTDNALRYGAAARLSLARDGDGVSLLVEDDGPGIPPEHLSRMTEPFERLEPSRGRASGGAGLGLSIVSGLAKAHGAEFKLSNGALRGLTARVCFSHGRKTA